MQASSETPSAQLTPGPWSETCPGLIFAVSCFPYVVRARGLRGASGDWDQMKRSESPPWEIERSSFANRDEAESRAEDCETGLPPTSQSAVASLGVGDSAARSVEQESVEVVEEKGTPSTLSDEADDCKAATAETAPRLTRGGSSVKKRPGSKGVESEGHETSEDGQDARPKPRKSARLA